MDSAGLRSPGRKERLCICNDACHQHSVLSVILPPMLEVLRINYRNSDIIQKVNTYLLTWEIEA